MNKDIDFNSKKFLILLLIVCVSFFVVIIKAFEYLPNNDDNLKPVNIQDINKPNVNEDDTQENNDEDTKTEKKTLNITLPKPTDSVDMEEIDAPKGVNLEPVAEENKDSEAKPAELTLEQKTAQALYSANKYRIGGQYEKALSEYQALAVSANDKEITASCYEGIAAIYAAKHKYGTALSYATRAYNMSPSSSRELLLARLYYKTGDIDKATKRINNVLHRDFTEDK